MQHMKRCTISLLMGGCLAATSAYAAAIDPKLMADHSWITLNGTVVTAGDETFRMDYGEGIITVEMDDWDWYPEGAAIIEGDNVTVSGRVDNDLFENASIEASTVYVEGLKSYYFANPADEEADPYLTGYTFILPAEDGSRLSVTGTVTKVDGREFTINNGDDRITIDTITMPYNPLDDEGYQKIDKGDRVSVMGKLDLGFFEDNEIIADSIVSLHDNNQS